MPIESKTNWTQIVRSLLEHYTQTELADKTGVHQGTISEMNRGIPKPRLSYENGIALMNAYDELQHLEQELTA